MAEVKVPSVGIDLPVYHGSTEDVLRKGAGHIYGSSLPVGGVGTHAVLTGHSGLPEATLFTNLHKVKKGALVTIDVYGRHLVYRVVSIDVILPKQISGLRVRTGRDLVSLVTCTPIGVNTHRLVVTAERVADETDTRRASSSSSALTFPWWIAVVGTPALYWPIALVDTLCARRGRPSGAHIAAGR